MYSDKKRNANFVLPIAKRQIMFSEDDCLEEGSCGFNPDTLSEEYLEKLELIYLTYMSDSLSQLTDAYPIVEYYSDNSDALNRFVESITVAIVSGKKVSFGKKCMTQEDIIEDEVIAYITTPENVSTAICNDDLCKMLYLKPELTVSPEGVLLFYTPTTLYATIDCVWGNIVDVEELAEAVKNEDITSISNISIADDGSTVIKFNTNSGKETTYHLSIAIDLFCDAGVIVEITN